MKQNYRVYNDKRWGEWNLGSVSESRLVLKDQFTGIDLFVLSYKVEVWNEEYSESENLSSSGDP